MASHYLVISPSDEAGGVTSIVEEDVTLTPDDFCSDGLLAGDLVVEIRFGQKSLLPSNWTCLMIMFIMASKAQMELDVILDGLPYRAWAPRSRLVMMLKSPTTAASRRAKTSGHIEDLQ